MRPILLKGHERSITCVIYNADGDLLFTAAKDHIPTLWYADTGERIGTYNGHQGAVWDLAVNFDSTRLLSASADATARLWDVQSGEELVRYSHSGPVRSVAWADGGERFATVSDPFVDSPGRISVYETPLNANPTDYERVASMSVDLPPKVKATRVLWAPLNDKLIVSYEDGTIKSFDPSNGKELQSVHPHSKSVNRMHMNKSGTLIVTSSKDYSAKLLDTETLEVLKTYQTDRPVNAAVIHPTKDHVLLGGGQDAMSVTTTSGRVGKFETRFYHMIYEDEFGRVKGHFGPINALAVNPDGRSYSSGAEDGYTRLHHFDKSYLDKEDDVPDNFEEGVNYDEAATDKSKEPERE